MLRLPFRMTVSLLATLFIKKKKKTLFTHLMSHPLCAQIHYGSHDKHEGFQESG